MEQPVGSPPTPATGTRSAPSSASSEAITSVAWTAPAASGENETGRINRSPGPSTAGRTGGATRRLPAGEIWIPVSVRGRLPVFSTTTVRWEVAFGRTAPKSSARGITSTFGPVDSARTGRRSSGCCQASLSTTRVATSTPGTRPRCST